MAHLGEVVIKMDFIKLRTATKLAMAHHSYSINIIIRK